MMIRPLNPSVGLTFARAPALFLKGLVRQRRCLRCGRPAVGGSAVCLAGVTPGAPRCLVWHRDSAAAGRPPPPLPPTTTSSIQQIAKIITWCLLCRGGGGEAGGEKLKKTRERKEKVSLCLSRTLGGLEARPLRHTIETSCHAPPRCLRCAHDVVSSDVTNGGVEY